MPFLQLIEFQTDRIDEFDAAVDDWLIASAGWRTATRAMRTRVSRQAGDLPADRRVSLIRRGDGELQPTRNRTVRRASGFTVHWSANLSKPRS